MNNDQMFSSLKPRDVFYIVRSSGLWQKDSHYSKQAINFFDSDNVLTLSPDERVTCVWSDPIPPTSIRQGSIFFCQGPVRTGLQARVQGVTSEIRAWLDSTMRSVVTQLRGMSLPKEFLTRQVDYFEQNIGNAESWNDQVILDDGQMLWLIIREKLIKDASEIEDRVYQYQVEVVARIGITPYEAGQFRHGTVVKDKQGSEYLALSARHDWLEVAPIENGRAQVSSDTCFKFLLNPERAHMYPGRRFDPVFKTGRNYYDQERFINEQNYF